MRFARPVTFAVMALAVVSGEWERAARLHGAADAISAQMGYHREPADEASLAPFIMRTREVLEDARFLAAESAGRALSYDEAIAEARSWLEQHS